MTHATPDRRGLVTLRSHKVLLPTPISTNNLYRSLYMHGKVIVVKSKSHNAWIKKAKALLPPEDKGLYRGSRALVWTPTIYANVPWGHDIDNMAKAVIDLIAKHYGLEDGYHDEVHIYRVVGDHMLITFAVQDTGLREGDGDGQAHEGLPAEPGVTPPAVPG